MDVGGPGLAEDRSSTYSLDLGLGWCSELLNRASSAPSVAGCCSPFGYTSVSVYYHAFVLLLVVDWSAKCLDFAR